MRLEKKELGFHTIDKIRVGKCDIEKPLMLHKKPEIVKYYNKHKIRVDIVDQKYFPYNGQRGASRWPILFFFHY